MNKTDKQSDFFYDIFSILEKIKKEENIDIESVVKKYQNLAINLKTKDLYDYLANDISDAYKKKPDAVSNLISSILSTENQPIEKAIVKISLAHHINPPKEEINQYVNTNNLSTTQIIQWIYLVNLFQQKTKIYQWNCLNEVMNHHDIEADDFCTRLYATIKEEEIKNNIDTIEKYAVNENLKKIMVIPTMENITDKKITTQESVEKKAKENDSIEGTTASISNDGQTITINNINVQSPYKVVTWKLFNKDIITFSAQKSMEEYLLYYMKDEEEHHPKIMDTDKGSSKKPHLIARSKNNNYFVTASTSKTNSFAILRIWPPYIDQNKFKPIRINSKTVKEIAVSNTGHIAVAAIKEKTDEESEEFTSWNIMLYNKNLAFWRNLDCVTSHNAALEFIEEDSKLAIQFGNTKHILLTAAEYKNKKKDNSTNPTNTYKKEVPSSFISTNKNIIIAFGIIATTALIFYGLYNAKKQVRA